MTDKLPPQDVLRQLLDYDPETGIVTWRERSRDFFNNDASRKMWNGRCARKPTFDRRHKTGYLVGRLLGRSELSHRVIWKWVTGVEPATVDHINRNKADNRLENLRAASYSENLCNRRRWAGQKRMAKEAMAMRERNE